VEQFKEGKFRCDSLLIIPQASPADLYPKVLGYDLSTRIKLKMNKAPNIAMLDQSYHIEKVTDDWEAHTDLWQTQWQLWEINQYRSFRATHDGYLQKISDVNYTTAHDAATADSANNDGATFEIGQWTVYAGAVFTSARIQRGYMEFNTTPIGAGETISEAYVLLRVNSYLASRTWAITITDPSTVDNPLVVADYGTLLSSTADWGNITLAGPGWIKITLDPTKVTKAGISRFAIRSSRDIAASDPGATSAEYAVIAGSISDYPPRLVVRLA
jgi:hypothetical protein